MESLATQIAELNPIPNNIARIHYTFFQKNSLVPLGCRQDPPSLVVALPEGEDGAKSDILSIHANMPIEKRYVSREEFFNFLNILRKSRGTRS